MQHLVLLMITHILADAVFQNRETAQKKSESLKVLLTHLMQVSIPVFMISVLATQSFIAGFYFTLANAIIHGLIDWNIWNGYKYLVEKRALKNPEIQPIHDKEYFLKGYSKWFKESKEYAEDPWFYTFIVWDQALHHVTFVILCGLAGVL